MVDFQTLSHEHLESLYLAGCATLSARAPSLARTEFPTTWKTCVQRSLQASRARWQSTTSLPLSSSTWMKPDFRLFRFHSRRLQKKVPSKYQSLDLTTKRQITGLLACTLSGDLLSPTPTDLRRKDRALPPRAFLSAGLGHDFSFSEPLVNTHNNGSMCGKDPAATAVEGSDGASAAP